MQIKSFGNMPIEDYQTVMAVVLTYLLEYEKSGFNTNKEIAEYIQDYLGIEINKCNNCGKLLEDNK